MMLDERLREATDALKDVLAASTPPPIDMPTPRASRFGWAAEHKPGIVAANAFVAVVVLIGAVSLLFSGDESGVADDPIPLPQTTVITAGPGGDVFVLTSMFEFDSALYDLGVTPGWIWTASDDGVHRVDPTTGQIETTVELPSTSRANIEVGEHGLWITHGTTLTGIDPETAVVMTTVELETETFNLSTRPGGDTRPLAIGHGSVWVATNGGLLQVDPDPPNNTVKLALDSDPDGVAIGPLSVWVLAGQQVLQIDPTSLDIVSTVEIPGSVFHPSIGTPLAYGQDALWVFSDGLTRLDPATGMIFAVYNDPNCCGPTAIGFSGENVITTGLGVEPTSRSVVVIDPNTGALKPIQYIPSMGVFTIIGDADGFWAAASRDGALYRFDIGKP